MKSQPMICVRDVERSSEFYCKVLGASSGHGGDEYDQIISDGRLILQLHHWALPDHHGILADQSIPLGNGVLLWFQTDDFQGAVDRAREAGAVFTKEPHENPLARHMEFWLRDPDGYLIVIAGPSSHAHKAGY